MISGLEEENDTSPWDHATNYFWSFAMEESHIPDCLRYLQKKFQGKREKSLFIFGEKSVYQKIQTIVLFLMISAHFFPGVCGG
jgi:hypothetical protein